MLSPNIPPFWDDLFRGINLPLRSRFLLMITLCLLGGTGGVAAPLVSASISSPTLEVGEPFAFTVSVEGATEAVLLDDLVITGALCQKEHTSPQHTWRFVITPLKSGRFVLPALRIRADGGDFRTSPMQLHVSGETPPPPAPLPASDHIQRNSTIPFFGHTVIGSHDLFVGQCTPVRWDFFADDRYGFRFLKNPSLSYSDVVVGPVGIPRHSLVSIKNRNYKTISYTSTLTPLKPGEFSLSGPHVRASGNVRNGSTGTVTEKVFPIHSASIKINVKPLPPPPSDYSGAIGLFSMISEVHIPEGGTYPTITLRISGNGNFAGISPPPLELGSAWDIIDVERSYLPHSTEYADAAGDLTFVYTLRISDSTTELPAPQFSYFDPEAEQYVLIRHEPSAYPYEFVPPTYAVSEEPQPTLLREFTPASFTPAGNSFLTPTLISAGLYALLLGGICVYRARKRIMAPVRNHLDLTEQKRLLKNVSTPDHVFLSTAIAILKDRDPYSQMLEPMTQRLNLMRFSGTHHEPLAAWERDYIVRILFD